MNFEKRGWIFAQTPIWAACDPNLTDGAHRLLTYLDWRQGNDDCCWPSVGRIARDMGSHEDTIRRRLRELEEAGYLVTTRRRGRSNVYTLIADPARASDRFTPRRSAWGRSSRPPAELQGGSRKSTGGGPAVLRGGTRKSAGGGPADLQGGSRRSAGHDDKKEQEKKDKEQRDELAALWAATLRALQSQMTRATFDAWLATATARRDEDTLVIQLAHARAIDWISNRLHGTIVRAVRRAFAEDELSIVYELQGEPGRRRT